LKFFDRAMARRKDFVGVLLQVKGRQRSFESSM